MRRQLFGRAVIFRPPTRWEVSAITGDPSVSARRPPDDGWTPRLGRTLTSAAIPIDPPESGSFLLIVSDT